MALNPLCSALACLALTLTSSVHGIDAQPFRPVGPLAPKTSAPQSPSSLLQPALDRVARAGSSVDLNRWKGSNATREEVDTNLASMQKDIQSTLPSLLAAADAAPDSAAASLPVLLNMDALYSVLLRVAIASRTNAPRDQSADLDGAATVLDSARRDLGESLLRSIKSQEQRLSELQAAAQQANTLPAAQPATVPSALVKGKKKAAQTGVSKTR